MENTIDKVLNQIRIDVEFGDLDSLAELLSNVEEKYLLNYLPKNNS